jgi:aryl-alcohol dehydrogenase-like predicted oxidoreductase
MLPLTGTSSAEHMTRDLASGELTLAAEVVEAIENAAG